MRKDCLVLSQGSPFARPDAGISREMSNYDSIASASAISFVTVFRLRTVAGVFSFGMLSASLDSACCRET